MYYFNYYECGCVQVNVYKCYTAEPLIVDPPNNKGHNRNNLALYKGHFRPLSHSTIYNFNLQREDNLPTKDKMAGPNVS